MNDFITNFHFIRPLWFIALIPLFIMLWTLKRTLFNRSPWQAFIPSHLQSAVLKQTGDLKKTNKPSNQNLALIKPFIIGLLSILALAGPTWQKLPQPVYQTERGSVLIMNMSLSMYANDIKPNRLTRARFKAIDLLAKINEGEVGLIASTSDAFIISPLTQDIKNIELLLPALSPDIMPVGGSNPLAALTLANEMLLNAGYLSGDIYWFIDAVDKEDLSDIYNWSDSHEHNIKIFGVGTKNGAPITLPSGELLKDNNGAIIIPKLPINRLASIAQRSSGSYHTLTHDDADLNALAQISIDLDGALNNTLDGAFGESKKENKKDSSELQMGDQWQEQGAWLVFLIIPLLLTYFRRGGVLLNGQNISALMVSFIYTPLVFALCFSSTITTAYANNTSPSHKGKNVEIQPDSQWQKKWQNLWQTNDQQGKASFQEEDYQAAAQQFDDQQWQGSAHYKAGNYQEALDAFQKGEQRNSANSLYNQANALAKLQQYDKAIESYEKALAQNADFTDAQDNIDRIEEFLKKQENNNEQQQSNDQQKQDDEQKEQDQEKQEQSEEQQKQNDNQQEQSEEQQKQNDKQQEQSEEQQKQNDQQQEQSEEQQKQNDKQQEQSEEQQKQNDNQQEQTPKTEEQLAQEQEKNEQEQRLQKIMNKVTDDPYLLLRNKMQLEYQKRKREGKY